MPTKLRLLLLFVVAAASAGVASAGGPAGLSGTDLITTIAGFGGVGGGTAIRATAARP
jgi:hypothetical protein